MNRVDKIELAIIIFVLVLNVFFLFFVVGNDSISGFSILDKEEIHGPSDFVSSENIAVEDGKIVIDVGNEQIVLSKYENSGSMLPLINSETTGVGFRPESEINVNVGDIITFKKEGKFIVHRVVEKGIDEEGTFFITKGDNNDIDDGRIRFEEIESVLFVVIY